MKVKRIFLVFISLALGMAFWPRSGYGALSSSSESVTLSEPEWTAVQTRFEDDIEELIKWFETYEISKNNLTSTISELQNKSAELRDETRNESNLFQEIHLKELLNKLRDKLEENSDLDHESELKRKELEENCLSLIDLYNGRIEFELESSQINITSAQLKGKIDQLCILARQRNRIQTVLTQYGQKENNEKLGSVETIFSEKTNDRETLQLTLDLFKDRQKSLQDQIEKWSLEVDGLNNELKLQGEMKGFLKDIQDINADSNFPQGNLKQEDLEFLSGDSLKKKLFFHLNEVQVNIAHGQKLLARIEQLSTEIQTRLDKLGGDKKL